MAMQAEHDLRQQLRRLGIMNNEQLLKAGSTSLDRYGLADVLGVEVERIEQLVNRADLGRVPGMDDSGIRLLAALGITSLQSLACSDPKLLQARLAVLNGSGIEARVDPRLIEAWVNEAARIQRRVWK